MPAFPLPPGLDSHGGRTGCPDCALISPHAHPLPVPAIRAVAGWRLRLALEKELSVGAAGEGGWGSWGVLPGCRARQRSGQVSWVGAAVWQV